MSRQQTRAFYLQIPNMALQTSLCHILQISPHIQIIQMLALSLIIRLADIHLQGHRLTLRLDLGFAKCRPLALLMLNILSLLRLYRLSLLNTTNLRG